MSDDHDFDLGWGNPEDSEATADTLTAVDTSRDQQRQKAQAAVIAEQVKAAVEAARPGLDKIPDPVEPAGDGDLTPDEEQRLADCDAGIDLGNKAWFIQGKSLDTIALGRLFRRTRHKLEPERYYATIEEWAEVEKGISNSQCSKLRAAWDIGEVLAARGYNANPGQVRELVPVRNAHSLSAAVGLYVYVAEAAGADKVTATRLRDVVKMLPGNLALQDDEDPEAIARTIKGVLVGAEPPAPKPSTVLPDRVKRGVDRRAVDLADQLNRGRIPRQEVLIHLFEAFADPSDTRVYDAVFERMKDTSAK
ncbi:hypothetical protein [Streptomyces sp. NPDC059009]|uniref:hypothetical protein n=1 Tax=Streptomyces sp. NPDC059009 TaxID=3346694 RepID=UPI0036C730B5